MGNLSNWIFEVKKVDFRPLDFFPEKSWIFRQKTENIFLLILFVPKRPETHSRHDLLLFLPYKSIKMCKKAIFSKFWPF